jgi:hypothetical protein
MQAGIGVTALTPPSGGIVRVNSSSSSPKAWEKSHGFFLEGIGDESPLVGNMEGTVRGGGAFGDMIFNASALEGELNLLSGSALPPGLELEAVEEHQELRIGAPSKEDEEKKHRILRMSFTQSHNSANDAASPFLGDELSVHLGGNYAAKKQGVARNRLATDLEASHGVPLLLPVEPQNSMHPDMSHWVTGVLLAEFSLELLPVDSPDWQLHPLGTEPLPKDGGLPHGWFCIYDLGWAAVCSYDKPKMGPMGGTLSTSLPTFSSKLAALPTRWGHRALVLRQNVLLEYEEQDMLRKRPLGFLNLSGADVEPVPDDPVALRLRARRRPRPGAIPPEMPVDSEDEWVQFMIRTRSSGQASVWLEALQRASVLTVGSLYNYGTAEDASGPLGEGRFSSVVRGRRRCSKQQHQCALKIVDTVQFFRRVREGRERLDTLGREALTQATLSSLASRMGPRKCRMVRLLGVFETDGQLVLELELMDGKDLFQMLSTTGTMCPRDAARLIRSVLEAVEFCASNDIAHRDVKLSNLLYPAQDGQDVDLLDLGDVRLADFGMARRIGADGMLRGRCGTPGYVAPEILHAGVNEGYPLNVDVFSVGVVAYTVLCGYEPFYGATERQLITANKAAKYEFHLPEWQNVPKGAQDLVAQLLEKDPMKRPTPAQALRHPWLLQEAGESCGQSDSSMEEPVPPSCALA